jgi:DNA-binding IclR family transcriptional regulator
MSPASAHAVLAVLEDAGYIVRHETRKTYTLGLLLFALGSATLEQHPALDAARDTIRRLARTLGRELVLTTRAGNDVVGLARAGPRLPHGIDVGMRLPLVAPRGGVFVAWANNEDVEHWLEPLGRDRRRVHEDRLRAALSTIRALGYSVTLKIGITSPVADALSEVMAKPRDDAAHRTLEQVLREIHIAGYELEELDTASDYNVNSIAAPIFDRDRRVNLAMTIFGFPDTISGAQLVAEAERLREAALAITGETGGLMPASSQLVG